MNGEYRNRTDDLLRAKQVLYPAELIPLFFLHKYYDSLARNWTADLYIISVAL